MTGTATCRPAEVAERDRVDGVAARWPAPACDTETVRLAPGARVNAPPADAAHRQRPLRVGRAG